MPRGQDLGQSPVHDLDLAEQSHHHVRRLQVAMDHPPRVGIGHRVAGRLEDRRESGEAPRLVLHKPDSPAKAPPDGPSPALQACLLDQAPPDGPSLALSGLFAGPGSPGRHFRLRFRLVDRSGDATRRQQGGQRAALDQLHGEEWPPVGQRACTSWTGTIPGC